MDLREIQKANRANFRKKKAAADQALASQGVALPGSDAKVEALQQQVAQLMQRQRQTDLKAAKEETYAAFDKYVADGNVSHLNEALQNPLIRSAWNVGN